MDAIGYIFRIIGFNRAKKKKRRKCVANLPNRGLSKSQKHTHTKMILWTRFVGHNFPLRLAALIFHLYSVYVSCDASLYEFSVDFSTSDPLGLQLLPSLSVLGFSPNTPASKCGMIRRGDQLVMVNNISVTGQPLQSVASLIRQA